MSTEANTPAPTDAVLVVDTYGPFQPIRLPAGAFYRLHRETQQQISAFVFDHLRRFPQQPRRTRGDFPTDRR